MHCDCCSGHAAERFVHAQPRQYDRGVAKYRGRYSSSPTSFVGSWNDSSTDTSYGVFFFGVTIHVPLKRGFKMEITPDKKKLSLLVDKAYEGSLCLPNFQRDFVWSADAVADLIRSILRGYFLGSLLLLDCDSKSPPFAPISLRGAKPKTQFGLI